MNSRKNCCIMLSLAFLFLMGLASFGDSPVYAENPNMVKPGEFVIEPPTLINLGFEWYVEGDDNNDAVVEVWYRKKGDNNWKKALPLLRINREQSNYVFTVGGISWQYTAPNMFAGSVLDLDPDTEYECHFVMSDPDGVRG